MFSAPPRATTLLRVAARAALQHGKSTMNNLEIDWKDFEKWTTERNPDECYRYTDCGGCAVAQYLQDKYPGAKWVNNQRGRLRWTITSGTDPRELGARAGLPQRRPGGRDPLVR